MMRNTLKMIPLRSRMCWTALGLVGLLFHALAQAPVAITVQPTQPALPIAAGSTVALSVTATGTPTLRYQWQRNGVNIPGATLSRFSLPKFTPDQGGALSVVVANGVNSVRSRTIRIVPALKTLPASDALDPRTINDRDFPNRISGLAGSGIGSNTKATVERRAGEPLHAGIYGGASVWMVWKPGVDGIATLSTAGSSFDTLLAIYVQADLRTPIAYDNLKLVASNDDAEPYKTSAVTFNTTSTATYFIAIDGDGSGARSLLGPVVQKGDIVFSWEVETTIQRLPVFTSILTDLNLALSSELRIKAAVDTTGADSTSFQWFFNGRILDGAVGPEMFLSKITPAQVGRYYCRADAKYSRTIRSSFSRVVDVQIFKRSNNTDANVLAQDKFSTAADYQFTKPGARSSALPATARSGRPKPLGVSLGTSGTQIFNTIGAGKDEGEPDHCGETGGASEWYALIADTDGIVVADTEGSTFDTVLAAYYDNGTGTGMFDGLVNVACNNDAAGLGTRSRLAFPAVAGRVYYLAIDGVAGAAGLAHLNYAMVKPLGIGKQPASLTVIAGSPANFSVEAAGAGPLRFQWRKGVSLLSKATNSTFSIPATTTADAGQYFVDVADEVGILSSLPATLTVNVPPQFTAQPADTVVAIGGKATFTTAASGLPAPTFQWRFQGAPISGAATPTLIVSNVQPASLGGYSVIALNAAGSVTSRVAQLTTPPGAAPVITVKPAQPGQPLRVTVTGTPGSAYVVEQSSDMKSWAPRMTNLNGGFEFSEPSVPTSGPRLFRAFRR